MRTPTMAAFVLLVPLLAGCADQTPPPPPPPGADIQVLDAQGSPAAFAQVAAIRGNETVRVFNADEAGVFQRSMLPAGADAVVVAAEQAVASFQGVAEVPDTIRLETGSGVAPGTAPGILSFREPVDLVCSTPDQTPVAECGQFGEPVVEVAGDGAIWASATCCIGKAPPIWVSRDGGETFQQLRNTDTGLLRDSFGIEGDFAIDDAGNVYFFDISAATVWFTSYEADGTHRWTVPWTGLPLVDRPWVRAGVEDQVWLIYNSGSETHVYGSVDGGRTWTPAPMATFPCALGAPGQGPARDDLYVAAGCGDELMLWTSRDGGVSWDAGDSVPMPDVDYDEGGGRGFEFMNAPVADEAGNVYVPFTHFLDRKNDQNAVFVARRDAQGAWSEAVQVSRAGMNRLPWGAAGREGHVGLLWYGAEGKFDAEDKAKWRLHAAVSVDAAAVAPQYQATIADPEVLLSGAYGRALGDFIQADLTPDGRLVAVYAKRGSGEGEGPLTNRFISSNGMPDLAARAFLNGPRPG